MRGFLHKMAHARPTASSFCLSLPPAGPQAYQAIPNPLARSSVVLAVLKRKNGASGHTLYCLGKIKETMVGDHRFELWTR
jgi:hypothetical protein